MRYGFEGENNDEIMEIMESDRRVSTVWLALQLIIARRVVANSVQARIEDKEDFAMCLVVLAGNQLLSAPTLRPRF